MMGNGNTWMEEANSIPEFIQDLEDEDDLDNVVSHSDDFANVYLVELPSVEAIEANIPNSQLAFRDPPITFPSSNASCDPIPKTMMLSRGFASRSANTEYIPLESIRFREAILGSGHTFKNAEEFRNAIYQMSLGGRFEYKYKKNSPTHMSVKCSVDGCHWKITAHAVEGNVILRVHTYQVNHNHIAQDEGSSKVKVSSREVRLLLKMCLEPLQTIFLVKSAKRNKPRHNCGVHFPRRSLHAIVHCPCIFNSRFIMGCRPVLAIDSCHLSGPYKGALLSAIAYDADDGMFPLALGVIDIKESCVVFPSCLGQEIMRIVIDMLEIDYNEAFEKLVRFNENLAKWVAENNPEHWAMSKFLKKRWDKMTSNIAEAFNAWLREERHQTIYTLLLMHMDKLVAMLDTHMRGTQKWKSVVGPKTEEKLMSNIMRSGPISVLPYLGGTFKVFTGEFLQVINNCYNTHFQVPVLLRLKLTTIISFSMATTESTRLYTCCSSSRFLKLCNRLPPEKLDVVRDLQRIDITSDRRYDLTVADVGLVFGLPTIGQILHIATTPSDHPFGTLNTCEERLLNLPIGEEFRRCFIYYACATLLAPTSRIDGCRNLWHTIHEDGFRNVVNWANLLLTSLWRRSYSQPWSDELIKERLSAEISEFGSFGHGQAFDESSPARTHVEDDSGPTSSNEILDKYYAAERQINSYQKGIQHQLGIMRGLIQRLDARRKRSVHSPTIGHSGYAADNFPDAELDSPAARYDMPFHCTEEVPDTPIRHPPIIVVCDPLPLRSMTVARSHSIGRQWRVRRMAPNVLSLFIAQAQTRHSAIKMDLKEAAATVLDGDLDPRHRGACFNARHKFNQRQPRVFAGRLLDWQ
ncbi:hypothetical protein CK203_040615 [Vitis vinifera]|uniref:Transposase MuDR plant domain-containing protein n=1 Tax=Vitis vinifera TaxID=29760 RepID=A0A438HJ13_VITVI|nr:hypothetical protein CK203_040615 [Vitis vinifera]